MKIEFKESVTRSVEIELPYYVKNGCIFYKIYSEEKCISVCDLEGHESISTNHSGLVFCNEEDNKDSNENEFRKAHDRVSRILKSK